MRRLHIVLVSLVLSVLMLITAAAPVLAAEPADANANKPVAWVNWTGSNGADKFHPSAPHQLIQISVMKLTDGSTVGHFFMKILDTEELYDETIWDSYFEEDSNGVKVAHILSSFPFIDNLGNIIVLYICTRIEDNGTGTFTDHFSTFLWTGSFLNVPPPAGYWPMEDDLSLDIDGFSRFHSMQLGWVHMYPYMTTPNNIQIHITDANVPTPLP